MCSYTSSDSTRISVFWTNEASIDQSDREKTKPNGLCGVLTTIIVVLLEMFDFNNSQGIEKSSFKGIRTGIPPAKTMEGA